MKLPDYFEFVIRGQNVLLSMQKVSEDTWFCRLTDEPISDTNGSHWLRVEIENCLLNGPWRMVNKKNGFPG